MLPNPPSRKKWPQKDSPRYQFNFNSLNSFLLISLHYVILFQPIFPPSLHSYSPRELKIVDGDLTWYQPLTLPDLLRFKKQYPHVKLVVGNTEVGIEVKYKAMEYTALLNPSKVKELHVLAVSPNPKDETQRGLSIGAAVSVNRLREFIHDLQAEHERQGTPYLTRGLTAIRHMLTWFASNQIRNMACIGGNIVTASPISDLNPMLLALGALLTLVKAGTDGSSSSLIRRTIPIADFFLSYRKVDLSEDEIVESVFVPFSSEWEFVVPLKQARRREDDISIVTSGLRFLLSPSSPAATSPSADPSWSIASCSLSFGGMAPTTILAKRTAESLIDQPWTMATIERALHTLKDELSLPEDVPGGQAEYRVSLSVSFLFKSFFVVTNELSQYIAGLDGANLPLVPVLRAQDVSASENFVTADKPASRGEQHFTTLPPPSGHGTVGQSMQHRNADYQVSGETKYTGDMPLPPDALHSCLVTSTKYDN